MPGQPGQDRGRRVVPVPCHTGHGFSAEALLEALLESIGEQLWQTIRSFQEASMLLEHLGRHLQENGGSARADAFLAKARELGQQSGRLQRNATERADPP